MRAKMPKIFLIISTLLQYYKNLTTDFVSNRNKVSCNPRRRPVSDTYRFWQRQQSVGESFDKWLTKLKLRSTANNCGCSTFNDRLLREKILFGTNSDGLVMALDGFWIVTKAITVGTKYNFFTQ